MLAGMAEKMVEELLMEDPGLYQGGNAEQLLEQTGDTTGEGIPTGTAYHLNSKRLKTFHLRRIAATLGVVESASAEDTRTIIEGKLCEMGKDPTDVQVIIQGTGDGTFYLVDYQGVILTVNALQTLT